MSVGVEITADWERLSEGTPEERACFAAITITAGGRLMSQGLDGLVKIVRPGPYVSAYHLAEWFAWNWWRIRWEPARNSPDWGFAHRMASIGEGYIWPNISFTSDGRRVTLSAKPSREQEGIPFSYLADAAATVETGDLESAIGTFVEQVRGRLQSEGIVGSNLDTIWTELAAERQDPLMRQRRKLEALLGYDPGEAPDDRVAALLQDITRLGAGAVDELAAAQDQRAPLVAAEALRQVAQDAGFDIVPADAAGLGGMVPTDVTEAWRVGASAAQSLRAGEGLGSRPLSNNRLAQLCGVSAETLRKASVSPPLSFALDESAQRGRVVLRSKWQAGRRFDLARLLGDRLLHSPNGQLHPATRAYTWRQKAQRAFAAELLSPFEAVDAMLKGDYSPDNQEDVARHYNVSDRTIRTLLVNHYRLEREALTEAEALATA